MLYCNPRDDNVTESPALGTHLVAKFDFCTVNSGVQKPDHGRKHHPTIQDLHYSRICIAGAIFKRYREASSSQAPVTAIDQYKTLLKTCGAATPL
jgi:hypothetical protein